MKKIVVIGAGPAGAVASGYLAKQGFEVLVLEKENFPRFVIGESLLPKCMEAIEEAGLMPSLLEKVYQKNAAKANGVQFTFGATVTAVKIEREYRTVTYQGKDGGESTIEVAFVMDASGYGRVLPRLFDLDKPSVQKPRGAVFAHFVDKQRIGREGDDIFIYPFDEKNSWVWVIPFSDGTASVGIVSDTEDTKMYGAEDYREYLKFIQSFELLKGRFVRADYKREPTMILGYSVGVKRMFGEGYVLCGNSTEFLDPVFSSGVTLAVESAIQAAKLVEKELNGEKVAWQEDYEDKMKYGIEVFRSYVDGWYKGDLHTIFFHPKTDVQIKSQICSVLAGHVWDVSNPFVKKHKTILSTLAKVLNITDRAAELNKV